MRFGRLPRPSLGPPPSPKARERPVGPAPLRPPPCWHVRLAVLDLQEQQVQRRLVVLVVLPRLRHGEQGQQTGQVVVLRREPIAQQGDEGGVEHPLRVLPEGVARLAVAVGVHDVAVHERQDVGVRLHVFQRVVVHGLVEANRIERAHLVPVVREQEARVLEEGALGVGDEVAGVELHDVGGDVVARLAGAGAADDEDVEVAVQLGVVLGAVEGESVVL